MVSTGFGMVSMTFGYVRSSFKIQNFKILWRISSIGLLRCRNKRPINGLVRFVMTMKFSLNVMSAISNCNSTVSMGASNCPLVTIIWKSGGRPSYNIVCGATNRISRKSSLGIALGKEPVSVSLSIFNSRNPLENIAYCAYVLMVSLLIAGETL